ncbi:MAG: D-glycero-beta-D-manno-heptose 1,7-bisphosphate 7-phosphatase [Arcobacter sp.]|nr:D-glycero-beta-D-manno-heptose 1,7-bisphosphate 7-phosphatase [Arcobacter sp.]
MQTDKKKVIFLDRDGVINHDYGYVHEIEKFEFVDGVFDACKYFISLGYEIIIITNQSGIGRGYYTQGDFLNLTDWMINEFNKNGVEILKVYFCPHSPTQECDCRKPKIGMITQSLNDFSIDLQNSWLIGDKTSDIETAINANIPNKILIGKDTTSLFNTIKIIKK